MQHKPIQHQNSEASPLDPLGEWLHLARTGLAQHSSPAEPEALPRLARTLQRLAPAAQAALNSAAPANAGEGSAAAAATFAQTLESLAASPA